ncbi:MAG: TetR/AcrR family transcriptional regulator [Deltaproteobacteria bacterium]|jgi:AcrR family transcriptional regulator|nr:TetR/AcrR family transcriptional regulator [Deltaproteobacteria bacterium]
MSQRSLIELKYKIFGEVVNLPLIEDSSKTKELIILESTILFAKKGFDAVSIRDIAAQIGIKPSSLYNHFSSKEALFEAVVKHAEDLYLLYFKYLDDMLGTAGTFPEVLDFIFLEPVKMSNSFTCFAFSLIQTEQFRDNRSSMVYTNTFLDYSINFFKNWFDNCINRGLAQPFDTKTAAAIIMHSVLVGINLRVHEFLNQLTPYSFAEMFNDLKRFILKQACPDALVAADDQNASKTVAADADETDKAPESDAPQETVDNIEQLDPMDIGLPLKLLGGANPNEE